MVIGVVVRQGVGGRERRGPTRAIRHHHLHHAQSSKRADEHAWRGAWAGGASTYRVSFLPNASGSIARIFSISSAATSVSGRIKWCNGVYPSSSPFDKAAASSSSSSILASKSIVRCCFFDPSSDNGGWHCLEKHDTKISICLAVRPEIDPYMHVKGTTTAVLSGVKGGQPCLLGMLRRSQTRYRVIEAVVTVFRGLWGYVIHC